jgi:hypothetical protein
MIYSGDELYDDDITSGPESNEEAWRIDDEAESYFDDDDAAYEGSEYPEFDS